MSKAILDHVSGAVANKKVPDVRPGYTVRVYQKIQEGEKERTQIFEGLVIAIKGDSAANKMFTVRKIVDGIGVEKTFPLFSPVLEKIEVLRAGKVRRAKLYFMRDLSGKSTRLKDLILRDVKMIGNGEQVAVEAQAEESVEDEDDTITPEEQSEADKIAAEGAIVEPVTEENLGEAIEEAMAEITPEELAAEEAPAEEKKED